MNENIRRLLAQAYLEQADIRDTTKIAEKFAELIIRECMTICKQHPSRIVSNNWVADAVAPDVVRQFEEHFGVEELQQTIDFETQDPETAKGTKVKHFGVES